MQKIKIFKQLFVVICCLLMTTQICKADDEPVTPKNGVYQIANYNQLAWLFDVYIENNKFEVISVELLNNIEIPESKKWKSQSIYGKLNFDGKGKTISGLNNALFSTIEDTKSVIQNLILVVNVDKAYNFGAICNTNCGTIYKCTCKGSISVSVGTVAGICKLNCGTISYCTNNAKIYAKESPTSSYTRNIGGICAENQSDAKIINCTNYGELKGDSDIGGICGSNFGEIQNCTNNSPISECYSSVGGICGSNYGEISSCSNVCSVSGKNNIGGICGSNSKKVISCKNTAAVNGETQVGGIAGQSYGFSGSLLDQCCNSGTIEATKEQSGGICGYNNTGTINQNINTGTVKGGESVGGICGETKGDVYNSINFSTFISGTDKIGSIAGNYSFGHSYNCYYLSGSNLSDEQVTQTSSSDFSSGKVAYLLYQGYTNEYGYVVYSGSAWGQNLGSDDYPSFNEKKILMIDGKYTQVTFTNGTAIVNNKTYYETPKVENQYYQISTLNDLYWLVDFVNNGGCKNNKIQVKLVNDITIQQVYSNGSLLTGLKEWIPIGNINNQFSGLFEGQKHTIKGIYINNTNATYLGLFGFCDNAIIRDLNISDSYINGNSTVGSICGRLGSSNKNKIQNCVNYATIKGDHNAGGVCGEAINTTIDKCKNYGKISVTTNNCGGIVAQCASSTITNCENYGQINAQNSSVAGICAYMSVPPNVTDMVNNISNCINYGIINGNESAGGLVSYMNYANMNNCFNYETITSKKCSGGICSKTENSIIDKCANIGHIICSEKCYAGGLFGVSIDSKTSNCYNLVDIDTKNQGYCVGGLIGKIQRGTLTNSYSIGNINGNSSYWLGSLCGFNDNATITNCYYNNDNKFKAIYNADDATNKVVGISFLDLFGKISGFDNTIWNDGYLKDITSNSFVGYLPSLKPIEGEITPADTSFKFSYQLENYTSVYMLGSEFKPDGNLKITSTDRSISLKIDATKASYTSPDLSVVNNEIPVNVKYYDAFDLVYKIAVRKTNVKSITLLENSIPNPLIGYDLNLSNAKIKVEYYDSQNDKTIPVTADMVSNYDKSQVGNQLIRISYDGYDSYWDIEVIEIKPIQITFQESSINKVLFVGDEIDLSSSELLVDYNDFRETEKIKITKDMLSGFNNKKAGTQFVTITYQGLKTTFSIEVRAIEIISIVIEDNSFAKSMIVGDDLDLSNAKLNVCYNKSENNQTIPITSRMIVGFDKSKVGYQDIVVSYGGLKTSKSIYINSCTYRVVFEWDNNYSSVKAYAKCLENSNKNIDLVCSTIEKKETPATETEKGKIVYSTSAIFKYNKYTSVKEVEIPKLGKTIKDEEPTFNWDGINSASASFITEDGDVFEIPEEKISSKITKTPTADTDGEIEYSATFTYDGKEYTSTKTVTIPKLSSEYKLGDYIYTWDKEKPIIVFENNDSEFVAQEGKVIKEIINQQASLELEGKKTITIEYEINGTDYYKDIEIILPKLTPTANNIVNQISAKVWGYNNIIYINIDNNVYAKIFDINGHLIKSVLLNNSYNEIPMNKNGVYIVVIDNKSYKVSLF